MEYLFHLFPGWMAASRPDGLHLDLARNTDACIETGLALLDMILEHGMFLAPERIAIPSHPESERAREGTGDADIVQTRACFTLDTVEGVTRVPDFTGTFSNRERLSPVDLFGCFGIGLDPKDAEDLHITPCSYFSQRSNSLSHALIYTLLEVKELLVQLSYVKAVAYPEEDESLGRGFALPWRKLADMEVTLTHQSAERTARLRDRLDALSRDDAETIMNLIDTDRRPVWNLEQMIELMLGLLQSANSRTGRLLAYYRQREWRILKMYSHDFVGFPLEDPPTIESATAVWMRTRARFLKDFRQFRAQAHKEISRDEWKHGFVVVGTLRDSSASGGGPQLFRDYVRLVLAPREAESLVKELLMKHHSRRPFSAGVPSVCAI